MEVTRSRRIHVWSLAVDDSLKVDLQRLSYRFLSRCMDKVGSFMPRYNATEQLLSFTRKSRTYHAFLLPRIQGACKEDHWSEETSTKEKPNGA